MPPAQNFSLVGVLSDGICVFACSPVTEVQCMKTSHHPAVSGGWLALLLQVLQAAGLPFGLGWAR